jgi:hypothetical protein
MQYRQAGRTGLQLSVHTGLMKRSLIELEQLNQLSSGV